MKIRTIEDEQEIVYIEQSDITMLQKINQEIPISIYLRITDSDTLILDNCEEEQWIDFDDPSEISFFNTLDWIIDYQSTIQLPSDEINRQIKIIDDQINEIQINNNIKKGLLKFSTTDFSLQKELLSYKRSSLIKILNIKRGILPIPLPLKENNNIQTENSKIIPIQSQNIKMIIKTIFQGKKSS